MIPIIGSLLSSGLTMLGKLLLTKGKDKVVQYVKDKTGIDLSTATELKPEDIAKLKTLEIQNRQELQKMYFDLIKAEMEEETERIQAVNQTMRFESQADDAWQRRWRPYIGFVSGTAYGILILSLTIAILYGAFTGKNDIVSNIIKSVSTILTNPMFWSFPVAVLGISAYTRGKEKIERLKKM